jgi:hypothetical protein
VGTLLFITTRAPVAAVMGSFSENTNVLMVMTLIPLLGVAVELGGYTDALATVSRNVTKPLNLYVLSTLLAFAIGSVLLSAAIALLWVVLYPVAQRARKDPTWFLVRSLPRGYDAALLWTPASPATAVALSVSGATWGSIAAPGFLISIVVLALAVLVEWRYLAANGAAAGGCAAQAVTGEDARRPASMKLAALAAGLLSFILSIVVMESLGVTIYQAVLPCVLGTLLVWTALIRKVREGARATVKRLDEYMYRMSTQFLLMTTAGFIGTAVKLATAKGFSAYLSDAASSPTLVAFIVAGLVLAMSALGIHPQIGMVITYSLVSSAVRAYPPAYVGLALMLGSALGFNVSPVSATMLVTSSCAGVNTIEVGLKRHWKYALLVLPAGVLLLRALIRV